MSRTCDPVGGDGRTCIPGCYPIGQQCQDIGRDYSCSFGPGSLRLALEAQQGRKSYRDRNNELVLDAKSMEGALPDSIEAFFFMPGTSSEDISAVRRARQALIDEYGLIDSTAPPMLKLDLTNSRTNAPFSMAAM